MENTTQNNSTENASACDYGAPSKRILLPDNRWVKIEKPLLRFWEGDVWSDLEFIIAEPSYEQGIASFMRSIVRSGFCGPSGRAQFNFVYQQVTVRAEGELFDHNRLYIDRESVPTRPQEEPICDAFGRSPRRAMKRLQTRAVVGRNSLLQDKLLERMCWLSIARKVFLARAGYPEFCEPYAP